MEIIVENSNTLFSGLNMEDDYFKVQKKDSGVIYLKAEGYIIPIQFQEGGFTVDLWHPTEHELHTWSLIKLTNDIPYNYDTVTNLYLA